MLELFFTLLGFGLMVYGAVHVIDVIDRAWQRRFGDEPGPAPGTRREYFAVDVPADAKSDQYQVVVETIKPEPKESGGTSRE